MQGLAETETVVVSEQRFILDIIKVMWPILAFLILQTSGAIWWAAGVTTTLDFLEKAAVKDGITQEDKLDRLEGRLLRIENLIFEPGQKTR